MGNIIGLPKVGEIKLKNNLSNWKIENNELTDPIGFIGLFIDKLCSIKKEWDEYTADLEDAGISFEILVDICGKFRYTYDGVPFAKILIKAFAENQQNHRDKYELHHNGTPMIVLRYVDEMRQCLNFNDLYARLIPESSFNYYMWDDTKAEEKAQEEEMRNNEGDPHIKPESLEF